MQDTSCNLTVFGESLNPIQHYSECHRNTKAYLVACLPPGGSQMKS